MGFIDIGANLTSSRFQHDLDEVIQRAQTAGVTHQIVTGTNLASSQTALKLCEQFPHYLTATAGFHPHYASENTPDQWLQLEALWLSTAVVAIGETGLDYCRSYSSPQAQVDSFERHLQAAVKYALPLFLHERDANNDFFDLLSHYRPTLSAGAVLHCFTGSPTWLQKLLPLDIYFGITGWVCDPKRGQDLCDAVPFIPSDRLLIETDCPYLIPKSIHPKPKSSRNEPMYLSHVAQKVADLRGVSTDEISDSTRANAIRLFGLGR